MQAQASRPGHAWERICALVSRGSDISGASRGQRRTAIIAATMLVGCTLFVAPVYASCRAPRIPNLAITLPQSQASQSLGAVQSSSPIAANDADGGTIVGLWHVKFVSNGALYDEGFDQFHSDGLEILNDDGVPPAEGNICLGVFKKIGSRTYKVKHPAFVWDKTGMLIGTLIIRETITLDRDHDGYRGQFAFDFYDLLGNLTEEVTGDLSGERITVD